MTPRISTPDTDPTDVTPVRYAHLHDLDRYHGDPVFRVAQPGLVYDGNYEHVGEGTFGFWDESWAYAHTGFASERLARLDLLAYCDYELGCRSAWWTFIRYYCRRIATFFGLPVQYVNRFPTR